jgi:SOS-response transcriptional repressor LexA
MEDYQHANLFMNEALGLYSPLGHYRGVVLWMQGCIQWLLVSHVDDAILLWEQARSTFLTQKETPNTLPGWYEKRAEEMRRAIEVATRENCPPHPDKVIKFASAKYKTTVTGKFNPTTKHLIHSLPVLGQISAGKMYNGINPDCELEIREVFLGDNTPHYPINLRSSGNIIKIPQGIEHYVLRVTGNSMNAASPVPILDGDYVLMRAQNIADTGDIVAAEIVGLDDRATLKRYKLENGKFALIPESDDPVFQDPISLEREFTKLDDEFFVRGVVLAVLKRNED